MMRSIPAQRARRDATPKLMLALGACALAFVICLFALAQFGLPPAGAIGPATTREARVR